MTDLLVTCERCGSPADVDWKDVRTFGDTGPVLIMGASECTQPGCVDEDGSRSVMPPDEPGQLTREDRLWIRRQERLIRDLARAERALMEAV